MSLEIQGGGGGIGVGTVTLTGSEPSLLVQSGTKAVAATTVYATDDLYGVDFQVTIPQTEFLGQGPKATADLYGGYIQQIGGEPYTAGISYGQDVNAAGNLVDTLFVTVQDTTGAFTTQASVPLRSANTPAQLAKLSAVAAQLNALAAGG